MTPEQLHSYSDQGFNRVPVTRTVLADMETPLSSYMKLAAGPYSYLFESVQGGEKWGRYSIIGLPAKHRFEASGTTVKIFKEERCIEEKQSQDVLAEVDSFRQQFKVPELNQLPTFFGGLVGYFAYDCVRYVEPKLAASTPDDVVGTPDILLCVSDEVLVFDNLSGTLHLVVHADPLDKHALVKANTRLDELESALDNATPKLQGLALDKLQNRSGYKNNLEQDFKSTFGEACFKQSVERIKEYILAGDVMQVVISQRMEHEFSSQPINLYRALRMTNPSPYMYFLDMDDHHVVGSSPEILARLENGEVTVRPIAGTRRRGKTAQEDAELEQDLVNDPKEIAEHLMLIDLGRNDVGRVAKVGTVNLSEKMMVEKFSHVMHITSNVTGQLKENLDAMDVLKAALPAGTLSGAPKIRAMEIIDELEPVKRGIYGGAVGYLSWSGNMDTAIAIRTAVIKNGKIYVQAGAGVVSDSKAELEWKETMNKARALTNATDLLNK